MQSWANIPIEAWAKFTVIQNSVCKLNLRLYSVSKMKHFDYTMCQKQEKVEPWHGYMSITKLTKETGGMCAWIIYVPLNR